MNLTDKEILELNELCNGVADGTLTEAQKTRLRAWLRESEPARRYYIRAMGLSASLCSYASEMQVEAPDGRQNKIIKLGVASWLGLLSAAACAVVAFSILSNRSRHDAAVAAAPPEEYVARITGAKDCQWAGGDPSARTGNFLRKGQRLELQGGFAEITFDCGARVVLEGTASLDVNSAWDATLRRGTVTANVPTEAIGFRISNPAVQVVDLGTEFTMVADASGAAEVFVLKGEVEASGHGSGDQRTIVLHENQSRHFAASGISNVSDRKEKFARFTQPVKLDHFASATEYVHWSFDEADGNALKADDFGSALSAFDAQMEDVPDTALGSLRVDGKWQRALRFNGHLFAKAAFPGISGTGPHTVAFWIKVPEDANLSSAYAMVAWGANSEKLGSHPVHIGWNRNPTEGPLGVLRTDYGGGFALGATPLRDGRWHHVAVVFVPGEDPEADVDVKEYVDGKFEGEGKPSPPGTEVSAKFREENANTIGDAVWLGCRLGNNGPRKDRFRGEMDELCIADRALEPREIVELMRENRPLRSELASNAK